MKFLIIAILLLTGLFDNRAQAVAGDPVFADSFEGSGSVVSCGGSRPPIGASCGVTAGTDAKLILSHYASPDRLFLNAEILIGTDGVIQCAGCDCSDQPDYSSATVLNCPQVLTTPGLINAHDHISFQSPAVDNGDTRYDHRHDWRTGGRGDPTLTFPSTPGEEATIWGELRQVMGGATSVVGSGATSGFLRNLDRSNSREGLTGPAMRISTFPLGDSQGQLIESGCDYPNSPRPPDGQVYQLHAAEGIDAAARNEWTCAAPDLPAATATLPGPSVVHGIALTPPDAEELAALGGSVVWSPRSDLSLYGMTSPVGMLSRSGVALALGTNWAATGSMNMLREFACAASFSANALDGLFTDQDLLVMATRSAAETLGAGTTLGQIDTGFMADLTLFDARVRTGFDAAVYANNDDIVLVLRGGTPLFGEDLLMTGLGSGEGVCDLMGDVVAADCLSSHRICVTRETPEFTYAQLYTNNSANLHALYSCDAIPAGERSCVATRDEGDGISYSGTPTPDDPEADGVAQDQDNCGLVFNPPRPVDGFMQGDADNDGEGDACDLSPLQP